MPTTNLRGFRRFRILAAMTGVSALMAGCAQPAPPRERPVYEAPAQERPAPAPHFGYVRDIDVIAEASRPSGAGAVLGAVIGGVIGNQFGSGTGRVAATGAGVVGGAVVGNQIEQRNHRPDEIFRITVRMDNGNTRTFDYREVGELRVGDRVKIEAGQIERI